MMPYPFIRIEFWRISRKPLQMDLRGATGCQELFHILGPMNRSAIPDDQQPTAEIIDRLAQEENTFITAQRVLSSQCSQLPSRRYSTHNRQMIARLKDLEDRRLATRRIRSYQTWQQVESSLINTNDETPFAASFFFRAGQTSLRHRVMAASSRCVARSSGRCGVQSMDFYIRETWALWYVTLNSHSMTLATRSQVQTPP